MLKIPSNQSNPTGEFRRELGGSITREIPSEPPNSLPPWRDLSRLEITFYLNCVVVVGLWLEDLR